MSETNRPKYVYKSHAVVFPSAPVEINVSLFRNSFFY